LFTVCLRAISQFQREFLSLEADAGERVWSAGILMGYRGIIRGRRLQLNHVGWNFRDYILAFQDTQFHVRTAAFPLDLIVAWFQGCSVDRHGIDQFQIGFAGGESARCHQ
jgi:hypothetical protein